MRSKMFPNPPRPSPLSQFQALPPRRRPALVEPERRGEAAFAGEAAAFGSTSSSSDSVPDDSSSVVVVATEEAASGAETRSIERVVTRMDARRFPKMPPNSRARSVFVLGSSHTPKKQRSATNSAARVARSEGMGCVGVRSPRVAAGRAGGVARPQRGARAPFSHNVDGIRPVPIHFTAIFCCCSERGRRARRRRRRRSGGFCPFFASNFLHRR
jgi:hypothetical protein